MKLFALGVLCCVALPFSAADRPAADEHPYIAAVERYRAAREIGDSAAAGRILATDSRIWFGTKQGPGRPRTADGAGPWSEWDRLFRSRSQLLDHHIDGNSLRTTVREINDWFRLVERPASEYYVTYWFDAEGRIEGTLIHSIPDRPEVVDRIDEFKAWARRQRPGLLDTILPGDRIDPAKAREWKAALLDWRRDAGLPDPLAP